MQSFMALMQMVMMPMFFLSGALFPVAGLPLWLTILNRIDPLTYAVDPMRRAVFAHLDISAAARHALDPGVTWWGWRVPGGLEARVVALIGFGAAGRRRCSSSAAPSRLAPMLLGRDRERREIEAGAGDGRGRARAPCWRSSASRGSARARCSAYAAERAGGLRRLRARGVESEAQIPFAALLELLRPALDRLDAIPEPQARALEAALALRPGAAQERFAVGAATLSLLAESGPLAVLVDDAQWLDDGERARRCASPSGG